ncbi:unnamed protein product [Ixodes persulcatus]
MDIPGALIVRKLTLERIEELKGLIEEEQQCHKRFKRDVELLRAGQLDDRLDQLWNQIKEEAQEETRTAPWTEPDAPLSVEVDEAPPRGRSTPAVSTSLLTSLLKSPSTAPQQSSPCFFNPSAARQLASLSPPAASRTEGGRSPATTSAPTLSKLLELPPSTPGGCLPSLAFLSGPHRARLETVFPLYNPVGILNIICSYTSNSLPEPKSANQPIVTAKRDTVRRFEAQHNMPSLHQVSLPYNEFENTFVHGEVMGHFGLHIPIDDAHIKPKRRDGTRVSPTFGHVSIYTVFPLFRHGSAVRLEVNAILSVCTPAPNASICARGNFFRHPDKNLPYCIKLHESMARFPRIVSCTKQMSTQNSGRLPPSMSDGGNQTTGLPPSLMDGGNLSSLFTLVFARVEMLNFSRRRPRRHPRGRPRSRCSRKNSECAGELVDVDHDVENPRLRRRSFPLSFFFDQVSLLLPQSRVFYIMVVLEVVLNVVLEVILEVIPEFVLGIVFEVVLEVVLEESPFVVPFLTVCHGCPLRFLSTALPTGIPDFPLLAPREERRRVFFPSSHLRRRRPTKSKSLQSVARKPSPCAAERLAEEMCETPSSPGSPPSEDDLKEAKLSCDSVPNSPASMLHSDDPESVRDYKVWKKAIMLVWRAAANHKYANVFLSPVTDEMAPGYHSIVYRPMDLMTIKKNIESGYIKTTLQFQRDMMLMFQNAIMYNSSDHDVFHMAIEMQKEVMGHIQDFLATQLMVKSTETKSLRGRDKSLLEKAKKKKKVPAGGDEPLAKKRRTRTIE